MTPDQKQVIQSLARKKGQSMATYMRSKALEEAEEVADNTSHPLSKFAGVLREGVADKYIENIKISRTNKD